MRKSLYTLAPIALLMFAASTSTQAAANGKIDITGNVSHGTCDVKMSHSSLDLGNYTADDFKTAGVKKPVAGSEKTFSVKLENCMLATGAPKAGTASLLVTGSTVQLHDDLFNNIDTATTGVMLKSEGNPVLNNGNVEMVTFTGATGDEADVAKINGLEKVFTASLASNTADVAQITGGQISTPIMFQYDYN